VPVGYELFGVTLETPSPSKSYAKCACDFITKLIGTLNKNGGENLPSTVFPPESGISISKFDDLNYMEEVNPLYLTSTDANGNIVFNFALARVHMNSTAQAQNVRVFFRSCRASVTTSIYNPVGDLTTNSFYRSNPPNLNDPGTNDLRIPLLGVDYVTPATSGPPTLEYVNIPFFATPRVNPNTTSMLTQPKDSPNVQDIPNGNLNNHPMAFFGCWLDINLDRSEDQIFLQFDNVPGVSQWDGGWNLPANSNQLVSIYKSFIRDNHQCLVAEISFDGIDIPAGDVPGYSAWLAQRNLGFIQ